MNRAYCIVMGDENTAPLRNADLNASTFNARTSSSRNSIEPKPNSSVPARASGITARTRRQLVKTMTANGNDAVHARLTTPQKIFVSGALLSVPLRSCPAAVNRQMAIAPPST